MAHLLACAPCWTWSCRHARRSLSDSQHARRHTFVAVRGPHPSQRSLLLVAASSGQGKWEDLSLPENGFDKETASMVVGLLTVRAVQQVLVQLQEFNQLQAQWLNHFAAENQPQQGNEFIAKLLAEPGKEVTDPITRSVHNIEPQTMAHRILQVREHMADNLALGIASFAKVQSATVLRSHLAASFASDGGQGTGGQQKLRQ